MARLSEEDKKYLTYQIYSCRYDDPWVTDKKVARMLDHSISTINRCAQKAEKDLVIVNPSPKVKPHPYFKAALLKFDNKYRAYEELQTYKEIRFICMYHGDWDFRVTYDAPLDFEKIPGCIRVVADGVIGPALSPKVAYKTWEQCFKSLDTYVEENTQLEESEFDHNPRIPDWGEEEWKLYYYFLPDLRKPFTQLRKKTLISWSTYQKWKKTLEEYCTITAGFFPEGVLSYNDMTLCFRTRYEEYIVELFSLLPTSSLFYRIGDYFLANIFIPKEYDKIPRVYRVIFELLDRGIISDCSDGYGFLVWADYENPLLPSQPLEE